MTLNWNYLDFTFSRVPAAWTCFKGLRETASGNHSREDVLLTYTCSENVSQLLSAIMSGYVIVLQPNLSVILSASLSLNMYLYVIFKLKQLILWFYFQAITLKLSTFLYITWLHCISLLPYSLWWKVNNIPNDLSHARCLFFLISRVVRVRLL